MDVDISQYFALKSDETILHRLREGGLSVERYAERLRLHFTPVEDTRIEIPSEKLELKEYPELSKNRELARASVIKSLELLGLKTMPFSKTVKVNTKNYLKAFLIKSYYRGKALEAIMSRKEALAYFKNIAEELVRTSQNYPQYENISEMLLTSRGKTGLFYGAFDYTGFALSDGHVGEKCVRCKWAEAMKELNDPDYAYLVACHGDYDAVKKRNPAFLMTRLSTLAGGGPYCDFFYHDTRIHKDLSHPSKEFWEKLGKN